MTVKEFFRQVQEAERELYLLRQQREHIWEVATGIHGMSQNGIRSPSKRSRTETAGISMADLETNLGASRAKYEAIVNQAREIIRQIPQQKFREVLTLRYLCGHSWRTVSDEMRFRDPKSVFRVHGLALLAAEKIFSGIPPNTT